MDALARLIAWKLSVHAVPTTGQVTVTSAGGETNRYPSGAAVTFERISGHRDGNNTSCPGNVLYTQLDGLRAAAAQLAGPAAGLSMYAPSEIRGRKTVNVSGSLRFADGSAASGVVVDVEWQPADAGIIDGWIKLASAAVGADGSWRTSAEFPRSGSVRAAFGGDGARGPLVSSPRKVTILARLNISVRRSGGVVRVSGTADPATHVRLTVERRIGRRWVRRRRKLLKVRGGAYSARLRIGGRGKPRVSVQVGSVIRRRTLRVG